MHAQWERSQDWDGRSISHNGHALTRFTHATHCDLSSEEWLVYNFTLQIFDKKQQKQSIVSQISYLLYYGAMAFVKKYLERIGFLVWFCYRHSSFSSAYIRSYHSFFFSYAPASASHHPCSFYLAIPLHRTPETHFPFSRFIFQRETRKQNAGRVSICFPPLYEATGGDGGIGLIETRGIGKDKGE